MYWLSRCAAAFRFLTVFPIPGKLGTEPEDLAGSTPCFPLVGLLVGLIAAPAALLLCKLLPPMVAAVLVTLLLLGVSGGLHLDGLADMADGFFSSRPREQILAIMRDSRIGAMGVIALFLLLLLKIVCLSYLDIVKIGPVVLLMVVGGRCSLLFMMALLPYARPEGGLGTLFYTRRSKLIGLWGVLFFALTGLFAAGAQGVAAVVFTLAVVGLFAFFCKVKIGGATGDTLGAACECAETSVALCFSFRFMGC